MNPNIDNKSKQICADLTLSIKAIHKHAINMLFEKCDKICKKHEVNENDVYKYAINQWCKIDSIAFKESFWTRLRKKLFYK